MNELSGAGLKPLGAILLTAVSLAVGGALAGYGWARWWEPREPVVVEGLVWEYDNRYGARRDPYFEFLSPPEPQAVPIAERWPGRFADWPQAGAVRMSYYRERLPARAGRISLDRVASIQPSQATLLVYVEPGAAGQRDRLGMINVPAEYVIVILGDAYAVRAENEYEAEAALKAILWRVWRNVMQGKAERLVGPLRE